MCCMLCNELQLVTTYYLQGAFAFVCCIAFGTILICHVLMITLLSD